jgi:type VI secretion system protein VasD
MRGKSMQPLLRKSAVATLLALMCALVGCKSAPPPLKPLQISMQVSASTDVNPDLNGKAAPIVVRIYQLKDDAAFTAAAFFALFDQEQITLGPALIERREYELSPGEQRTFDYPVSNDAHFIGAVAAFRDIRNAQWRVLTPAPKQELQKVAKKVQLVVAVSQLQITLSMTK